MPVTNDDAGLHRDAEGRRADFNDVVIGHENAPAAGIIGVLFEMWEDERRRISHASTDMRRSLPMRGGRKSDLGRRLHLENETSSYLSIAQEPTKTLRGALALVTRRKLLHQIRGRSPSRLRPLQIMLTLSILSTIMAVVRYGQPRGTSVCGRAQLEVIHVTATMS